VIAGAPQVFATGVGDGFADGVLDGVGDGLAAGLADGLPDVVADGLAVGLSAALGVASGVGLVALGLPPQANEPRRTRTARDANRFAIGGEVWGLAQHFL
jgi:hypothetical protein